jgi:hypothetical protein
MSGNELLLTVDSPVWLQELQFYQGDIITKLALYEVKTVRFRLGRVNADEKSESAREGEKVKPLTADDRSFIEDTVSNIEDKELKEVVKRRWEKRLPPSGQNKFSNALQRWEHFPVSSPLYIVPLHSFHADSACFSKMRMGFSFLTMLSSVTRHSLIPFWEGISYITSSMISSRIERNPRAPVFL